MWKYKEPGELNFLHTVNDQPAATRALPAPPPSTTRSTPSPGLDLGSGMTNSLNLRPSLNRGLTAFISRAASYLPETSRRMTRVFEHLPTQIHQLLVQSTVLAATRGISPNPCCCSLNTAPRSDPDRHSPLPRRRIRPELSARETACVATPPPHFGTKLGRGSP